MHAVAWGKPQHGETRPLSYMGEVLTGVELNLDPIQIQMPKSIGIFLVARPTNIPNFKSFGQGVLKLSSGNQN